jgi:hypothetical protein
VCASPEGLRIHPTQAETGGCGTTLAPRRGFPAQLIAASSGLGAPGAMVMTRMRLAANSESDGGDRAQSLAPSWTPSMRPVPSTSASGRRDGGGVRDDATRSRIATGSFRCMAASSFRNTLKVPMRLIRMARSNSSTTGPSPEARRRGSPRCDDARLPSWARTRSVPSPYAVMTAAATSRLTRWVTRRR